MTAIARRVVFWKVRIVDRQTRKTEERILQLDEASMSDAERAEFFSIVRKNSNDPALIKFRKHFYVTGDSDSGDDEPIGEFHAVYILGYHEDEAGQGLDDVGLMQILTGCNNPIIRGNNRSVTRLGPSLIKDKSNWTVQKANDIAHYLQLTLRISRGKWMNSPLTLHVCGNETSLVFPDDESTDSMMIATRQFFERRDDVFHQACKHYVEHVDDESKAFWVKDRQDSFEATRKSRSFIQIESLSNEELLELHIYGSDRKVHRSPNQSHLPKLYRELKQKHGDKFLFAIGSAFKAMLTPIFQVTPVIAQDYRHWIEVEGCSDSETLPLHELFPSKQG